MLGTAETADADQIARMIRAMCSEIENPGGHEVSSEVELWLDPPNKIRDWLDETERNLVVAETAQIYIAGFGDCRSYLLGGAFKPSKFLRIGSLYAEPDHRQQGLGGSLLDAMLAWAKAQECEACELNVHVANPAARLNEKLGFDNFQTQMIIRLT